MKVPTAALVATVTNQVICSVNAQDTVSESASVAVGAILAPIFIFGLIWLVIAVVIPCCLYRWLVAEDETLPPGRKYMTGDMSCLYWFICLCCGVFGNVVFYIQGKNHIQNAKLTIDLATTPSSVGAAAAYMPISTVAVPPPQVASGPPAPPRVPIIGEGKGDNFV